jgi:Na+/proline symporter
MRGKRPQNIMLLVTQAIGILGSIAMIMSGIFSIDQPQIHSLFSTYLRIGLGTAFGFSVAAFLYNKEFKRWILIIGVITTLTDFIVSVFYDKTHLLEWPVISLFLLYCLLLGNETYRLQKLKNSTL